MYIPEPEDIEKAAPHTVCLDIVLTWAESLGAPNTAKVMGSTLILCAVNHQNRKVMLNVPLSDEPARIGKNPRWNLKRLGPTVWKLTPSIFDERIHGYVTLVGVPEPAPWLNVGRVHAAVTKLTDDIDNGCTCAVPQYPRGSLGHRTNCPLYDPTLGSGEP
jgi:hypothetical protein